MQCPDHHSDGFGRYFVNEEKGIGSCFSCDLRTWTDEKGRTWAKRGAKGKTYLLDSNGVDAQGDGYTEDTFKDEEWDVMEDKPGTYKPLRGITEDTLKFFDVKTYQGDGKEYQEYVYPTGGIKVRYLPKEFSAKNGFKGDELFGSNLFPAGCAKKIVITEGELDAMAAWQMLKSGSYVNPVVSVPGANPSGKLWEKCGPYLDSFDQILLSLDKDEPGKKLAEKITQMFPGKVFELDHQGYKDANEVLKQGDPSAYKGSWWKPTRIKPEDALIDPEDYLKLYDESPDFEYFTTGLKELDEKILGICKGYFTVILAKTGVGKTEVMRYLEHRLLSTSDYKFGYLHLEESKLRSLLGLVSYDLGQNFTLKKFVQESGREEEVREAITNLSKDGRMIQVPFKLEEGYETLIERIKFYKAAFDIDYFFFEPIQDVVTGEDKEGKLSDLSSRLGTLASEIGVGIVTIAHQNQNGETMYATMIGKKAAFEIILERDQEAEDLEERNRTHVKVGRKNRVALGTGPAGALDFDLESFTLKPVVGPQAPVVNREDF